MTYRSRSTKRPRRTKEQIQRLRDQLYEIAEREKPVTVRRCYYAMIWVGAIPKDEKEYKNTVMRLLLDMRRKGVIPYDWITDTTRWPLVPRSFDSVADALSTLAQTYRRSIWKDQGRHVEVWDEKRALGGVLYEETAPLLVPLMVAGGFSSEAFLRGAADDIIEDGNPAFIYLLTDHDPSGVDIARVIERKLRAMVRERAPQLRIECRRIAVTAEQIEELQLPTRETKLSDPRAKKFKGPSVDLDAIPAPTLRRIVREAVESQIDPKILRATQRKERRDRERLFEIFQENARARRQRR